MRLLTPSRSNISCCAKDVAEGINNAETSRMAKNLFACAHTPHRRHVVVMPPTRRNPSRKSRTRKVQPRLIVRNCCLRGQVTSHTARIGVDVDIVVREIRKRSRNRDEQRPQMGRGVLTTSSGDAIGGGSLACEAAEAAIERRQIVEAVGEGDVGDALVRSAQLHRGPV